MTALQQPDVQVEKVTEGASFWAENCLEMIGLTTGFKSNCDLPPTSYPTPETTQSSFQVDFQLSEYGVFNASYDPPMSFRDRHRFLDGIYNSYPDPTLIKAEDIGDVARKVGLLMEEVLAWFKDEKLRRAKLLANNQRQAEVPTCQFPPSPESTRASKEVSPASSPYNSMSPGMSSQPPDAFSECPTSTEDKKLSAPPKSKRGRPAKTHIKTEPDLPSPDPKRKKTSIRYPCPDCGNFVPSERYSEHISRKHFPEHIWECPKTNQQTSKPCSSNPHYRPSYRLDNFATHLKGEHDCSDSEVVELKKTCKFKVLDFFHKICGFCDKGLGSRDESIEHVKEHFRHTSQEPNPPTDLGVSLWKEKCGSEHKLQLGVHYRRSKPSKPDLMNVDHDYDHGGNNGNEGEDGGSGEGDSDNPDSNSSGFQPNNRTHDHGNDKGRDSGESCSNGHGYGDLDSQPNDSNHSHDYDHNRDRRPDEDSSDASNYSESIGATFYQDEPHIRWPKMQNPSDLPAIPSLPISHYERRSESQESASSSSPRRQPAVPCTRTQTLTSKEDANFQCHVKGCGKLFGQSHNFKAHMESHDVIRDYPFTCAETDCNVKFLRDTDLQRHHQSVHIKQRNHQCHYCSRFFARKDTSKRYLKEGYPKYFDIEIPNTTPSAEHAYYLASRHIYRENEDVDFPLYPDPQNMYSQHFPFSAPQYFNHDACSCLRSQDGCPTNSVAPYAESPPYNMVSPKIRAPSNYSAASGPSAVSSVTGSSDSIRGQEVPVPEWCSSGPGLNSNITSSDESYIRHEYGLIPVSLDEFALDAFNPTIPNSFVDSSILYPLPAITSHQLHSSQDSFNSEVCKEKSRCTYPDCGRVFKDLKAHMLTHTNERPEKCPIQACEYHIKGFARKYDKNRHTLTHYKGTMVCGFCPGSGFAAEKTFNRADVFKRHLASVHAADPTPPNSRKKISATGNANRAKKLSAYAPDATGKCSTCSETFSSAQEFYEHLDDCVLHIVQQEESSEAINAARLAEVENNQIIHETFHNNALPATVNARLTDEDKDDQPTEADDNYILSCKARRNDCQKSLDLTHTKGSFPSRTKGQKEQKECPSSWGIAAPRPKTNKRILYVFDRSRRLWKDDLMLDAEYEVRMKLRDGVAKTYITDLETQTIQRAEAFHNSAQNKGSCIADITAGRLQKGTS